jgi:hypothetical protein
MPLPSMFYPNIPCVRTVYLLMEPCAFDSCLGEIVMASEEFYEVLLWMLFDSVSYTVLALYLNEVVPK